MNQYLFLLGKTIPLCTAELDWILSRKNLSFSSLSPTLKTVEMNESDLDYLTKSLGGTVKIAQILSDDSANPIESIILDLKQSGTKVNFSVIGSSEKNAPTHIKNSLKEANQPSRYVEARDIYDTAMGMQKNYHEYWIVPLKAAKILAKVIWMQDIKVWSKKDFGRPRSDPRSGMLPPKIARIMLNLALKTPDQIARVYDPFCGSGTILMEALNLGHEAIGSDLSLRAVEDTTENLYWYQSMAGIDAKFHVFLGDAVKVNSDNTKGLVDAIVFEPFLGPPRVRVEKIRDIAKGLEKLYIGTLKNLSKLLPSGNRLVCIFPTLKAESIVKRTDNLIDRCENFGYTLKAGPLEYSRPDASVVRQIYVLEKKDLV